jgi:hypothetical protein
MDAHLGSAYGAAIAGVVANTAGLAAFTGAYSTEAGCKARGNNSHTRPMAPLHIREPNAD